MELCDEPRRNEMLTLPIADRTTTSVNILYNNNMILIISASSSIVLIRTVASSTIRFISNPFDIFYCITLFNDILYSIGFFPERIIRRT